MYYILRDGKPVAAELLEWAAFFENPDNRRIDLTVVSDVEISTVFVGIDQGFVKGAAPLLFETRVFGGDDEHLFWRYSTIEKAKEGHLAAVELVRNAIAEKPNSQKPATTGVSDADCD